MSDDLVKYGIEGDLYYSCGERNAPDNWQRVIFVDDFRVTKRFFGCKGSIRTLYIDNEDALMSLIKNKKKFNIMFEVKPSGCDDVSSRIFISDARLVSSDLVLGDLNDCNPISVEVKFKAKKLIIA